MCDVNLQGWACCSEQGGRAKCPAAFPFMCGDPTSGVGGTDYSCQPEKSLCDDSKGGIRKCGELMSCDIYIMRTWDKLQRQVSTQFRFLFVTGTTDFTVRIKVSCTTTSCIPNFSIFLWSLPIHSNVPGSRRRSVGRSSVYPNSTGFTSLNPIHETQWPKCTLSPDWKRIFSGVWCWVFRQRVWRTR